MKIKEMYEKINDGVIKSDIELQRDIVYDAEKQSLVIDSIMNDIPLPAFYFWENADGTIEVIDGKQRVEAIKKFKQNNLQYDGKIWLEYADEDDFQDKFNNTDLTIIHCSGTEKKKREIFKRINTLGVPLSKYEVLNGLYNGTYLRGLTTYVSKDKDAARVFGSQNRGSRQIKALVFLLQLKGIKPINDDTIGDYVNRVQETSFENDQKELSKYVNFISKVLDKCDKVDIYFRLSRKYLKDIAIWKDKKEEINEELTTFYKSDDYKLLDAHQREQKIENIIMAIVNGITVDKKRLFTREDKEAYLKTKTPNAEGKYQCEGDDGCGKWFFQDELQMDHIDPWSLGGRTELSNAQLLCRVCNGNKSNRPLDYKKKTDD